MNTILFSNRNRGNFFNFYLDQTIRKLISEIEDLGEARRLALKLLSNQSNHLTYFIN